MAALLRIVIAAAALPSSALAYTALVGLGVARNGSPLAVTLSATAWVFLPALLATGTGEHRGARLAVHQLVWSMVLFLCLPVYFPGERREAVATGIALITMSGADDGMARAVASALPDEPELAAARVPLAEPVPDVPMPPAGPLADHEIALPYEGEGRRLSVPVVFQHGGVTLETYMMLDTGATYTTLPLRVLRQLGIEPGPDAPELTLSTANGDRTASVVLLDRVWLGDLAIDGVAITTCEDCATEDHVGLLGLNVTGGYNLTIDADRHEVVFAARDTYDRRLDIRPFVELDGRFKRFPGGRVEFALSVRNDAPRDVGQAIVRIGCGPASWNVAVGAVASRDSVTVERRLPGHEPCTSYELDLTEATW